MDIQSIAASGGLGLPGNRAPSVYPRSMRDLEIRLELDRHLRGLHDGHADTVIRHELGVEEGRRRIDVAVVNGSLSGWEIKSDADTLYRLEGQAQSYGRVFDYVSIVTTPKYHDRAIARLPEWWGVLIAQQVDDEISLTEVRAPRPNSAVEPMSLVQLLWRDEAMAILKEIGMARGLSGKARWFVWERLASALPIESLQSLVRNAIKVRQEWQGGSLPLAGDATSLRTAIL